MKKVDLESLKAIEAELLYSFDKICVSQNFRYSLAGGTLLGAVRHHGFIPWDDDIDVMMPRPDYNSFIAYCQRVDTPFRVMEHHSDENYLNLYAKIEAYNTFTENHSNNIRYGINIDVFPIDGVGNTYEEAKNTFNKTSFFRELLNACKWRTFSRSKTKSIMYEPIRFFFYIISRFSNPKQIMSIIEKRIEKCNFDTSSWAGCLCGSYRLKEIVPKEDFTEYIDMVFENHLLKGIKNYDRYLSQHYGDYMTLPSKDKQVTHHSFDAFVLDEGDEGYKVYDNLV